MSEAEERPNEGETIQLDKFLKLADLAESGGAAKHLVRSGAIRVNGEVETRRGRKLKHGDVVNVNGEDFVIETTPDTGEAGDEAPES